MGKLLEGGLWQGMTETFEETGVEGDCHRSVSHRLLLVGPRGPQQSPDP